jgi:ankyrin repeat protein
VSSDDVPLEVRRLAEAVLARDRAAVRGLLHAAPDLIEERPPGDLHPASSPGAGWLHLAVAVGDDAILTHLIERGAPLDQRNADGRTALHDALEDGRVGFEDVLIEAGAEVDVCAAAMLGDETRLAACLAAAPDSANDRTTGLSPVGWAAFGNQAGAAQSLIAAGARLDDGELFCAASCGHLEVARVLLDAGADPNERRGGRCLLHEAARMRYTDRAAGLVEELLARGADPGALDDQGRTPLQVAEAGQALQDDKRDAGEALPWERDFAAVVAALARGAQA